MALQRAAGVAGRRVLRDRFSSSPAPTKLVTLAAIVIFIATGLRMRLVFMPLLLLLFLVNVGYSIGAVPFLDKPEVANWIATSWYMAFTVMFIAMVVSEGTRWCCGSTLLRRGLDCRRPDCIGFGHRRLFQPRPRRT